MKYDVSYYHFVVLLCLFTIYTTEYIKYPFVRMNTIWFLLYMCFICNFTLDVTVATPFFVTDINQWHMYLLTNTCEIILLKYQRPNFAMMKHISGINCSREDGDSWCNCFLKSYIISKNGKSIQHKKEISSLNLWSSQSLHWPIHSWDNSL